MYILLGYFTLSIYINIHKENHFKNMKSHENYALKLVTRTCTPSPLPSPSLVDAFLPIDTYIDLWYGHSSSEQTTFPFP